MQAIVSVIVPVYNAELFLQECVESILSQTEKSLEIILVDDGSTDGSGNICDFFHEKDSRVHVIHKENAGLTSAVKYGVEKATGEWIFFVDADDSIIGDAIESLLRISSGNENILVGFSFRGGNNIVDIDATAWRKMMIHGDKIMCTRWGKLYNHRIVDSSIFEEDHSVIVGEDMLANIKIAFRNDKNVRLLYKQIYNYRRPDSSMTATFQWSSDKYYTLTKGLCEVLDSVGASKSYHIPLVQNMIGMLFSLIKDSSVSRSKIAGTEFHASLINEIGYCEYPLSTTEKILVRFPDSSLVHCIIKLQHSYLIVKQFVARILK